MSLLPYSFACSKPNFWSSGGQIFGRKWGFPNFLKKILSQFISCKASTLMGWVSWPLYIFVFLDSFFGPLVAKYLAENGVSGTFSKLIGSIHFIPGINHYGVSLLTPMYFRVPSLIFGHLVAKHLAENGFPVFLKKKTNYWPNSFHTCHLP